MTFWCGIQKMTLYCSVFLFLFWGVTSDSAFCDDAGNQETDCDIQNASCTRSLSGLSITLDIHPKPVKAMTDLIFSVSIEGETKGETPYIDLGMPGMEMGPNRVFLKETAQGEFEGNGNIVRCKSGRKTWRATITIPGNGTVEYLFDVIY